MKAAAAGGERWYFSTLAVVAGFLVVGPFILPLVWLNPAHGRKRKVIETAVILVLTALLMAAFSTSLASISRFYKLIETATASAQTEPPAGQETTAELEATEQRLLESDPLTDPEKALGEEVRDEETVDSDA